MFSLKDKVALVTGASQGIGRDTSLALSQAGAKVAVAARNEEKLAALVAQIVATGGEALAVKMDVADAEQVKTGFKQVLEKFGRLDILVNNAAITRDGLALRSRDGFAHLAWLGHDAHTLAATAGRGFDEYRVADRVSFMG